MDWSRAKTILILSFLLLDIFLAYQIISAQNRWIETEPQSELIPSSFDELLKTRHITLKADISKDTPEMHYINIRFTSLSEYVQMLPDQRIESNGNGVISVFPNPVPVSDSINQEDWLKNTQPYIAFLPGYVYDKERSTPTVRRYLQLNQVYPMFSAPLEIVVDHKKALGYRQIHMQVINQGMGRKVISAYTALRTLLDNGYIRYGEEITGISIGYYGHTYDADIQVLAPVWRVIHNGEVHYVNGITGAVEQAPPLEKNINISNNNDMTK
ncbi:two-component system regulatory protein YycI [Aneurinibacillus terranovensis]|uniref:two-component system regulatory protein YycI n=1 Tax=Aneurinibacillus terranovensis TaxID=278991 RepID=UPI000405DCB6|nr:two-component system regulatory protein YycI [Aneurinibacillus terranovensis]